MSIGRTFDVGHPRQVALVSGAHGVNEFFSIALPPILPLLIAEFDLSYTRAGLLVTAYFAMYAVFQLPAGFAADRIGGVRLITLGTAGMAAGMGLASAAPSYPALLGAVALAGVGGSTYHPAGMALISDVEGDETVGRAMGVHELVGMLGSMLAPVLVGGLAVVADWRLALAAAAAVGIVYATAFALLAREPEPEPEPASPAADGGERGADREPQRLREDLRRLIRVPLAWWVLGLFLGKLAFTLQSYGVRTYLTSYVVIRSGASAGAANATFFVFLAGSALATVWFGSLADRFDRLRLVTATFLVSGGLIAATAVVPAHVALLFGWFFALGVAVYATLPVVNTLVSEYAEREFSGSLFGVVQTASALGGTISPVLFGALASRVGMARAFPSIAAVCLLAGIGLLAVNRWMP